MRRAAWIVGWMLIAATVSTAAYDRAEFLFLDEVRIGMKGIGKTVVSSDTISEFDVEILGVIDQPGTLSDFIVVRVSGEAIGRSGGIAQGMSGSPIYVDGRLIGALSRAATWSKEITPIGLVTPIEPMLAVLDSVRTPSAVGADPSAVLDGVTVVEVASPPAFARFAAANLIVAYPVATPLVVSGLSGRGLDALMGGMGLAVRPAGTIGDVLPEFELAVDAMRGLDAYRFSLLPLAAPKAAHGDPASAALAPGGSMGIALATGDITLGALGTVTYCDGDAVIGFGHPFLSNGASAFPLTTAPIIDTMKSFEASFKLGRLGGVIGEISQDRTAAVGGRVGGVAKTIGLEYAVYDLDRGIDQTFDIDVVDLPRLMPELLFSSGLEATDLTLDRIGPGTVEVRVQIQGEGMPTLERKDVFLSVSDVAVYAPWQLAEIVAALQYNEFRGPEIKRIAASIRIDEALRAAEIERLELDSSIYAPGDSVRFELAVQTFQGEWIDLQGTLAIPLYLDADYLVVRAYGGPRLIEAGEQPQTFESLEDVVETIESLPSYETLTVELFALDPYSPRANALFGVAKVTRDFPGHVVIGEREVTAILQLGGGQETPAPSGGSNW
ncbi:MAG: SpoIVB peptidase S55 domain-containing protein [Candidatus Bipolaricaulis sp.]|nr:SpoIVB peptidase S55 domain-containing protein [Candidatus Bipolaricaulis sp.]